MIYAIFSTSKLKPFDFCLVETKKSCQLKVDNSPYAVMSGRLILSLSREVEAQLGDFAVTAFKELVYAPGDEVFVNLDLDSFVLVLFYQLEVCFDVYVHGCLWS